MLYLGSNDSPLICKNFLSCEKWKNYLTDYIASLFTDMRRPLLRNFAQAVPDILSGACAWIIETMLKEVR